MSESFNYHFNMEGIERLKSLQNEISRAFENSALTAAVNATQVTAEKLKNYISVFQSPEWLEIRETVKRLRIPTVPDERKRELLNSYTEWGKLGWTLDPEEELGTLFSSEVREVKVADREVQKRLKSLERVFGAIRECPRVKISDFEEAVQVFKERHYKSCALILFSLIDAQLIRIQKKDADLKKRRAVGLGAVSALKVRSDIDEQKKILMLALYYTNLFACLETVFASGNDFRLQPVIINRNYLAHGMMRSKVSRKSCIQLFLLYYNVLEMVDLLYS